MKRGFVPIFLVFFFLTPSMASAADWYVRPAGGGYGNEDGSSYANAWDGLENIVWGSGGVQAGDSLYVCGLHLRNFAQTPGAIIITVGASGSGEDSRITIRGDCPGDPGVIWGGAIMSHEDWVDEGSNTWSITLPKNLYSGWFFEDVTPDSWTVLDKVSSVDDCKATPGSFYSENYVYGSKLYVHSSDNGNPTGRITGNRLGYRFIIDETHHITWLNLKFYSIYRFLDFTATPPDYVTYMKWENCTFWYGEKLIFFFKEGSHHLEFIGCDIGWAQNGIGFAENSPHSRPNAPHHYVIRGNYFHHFGVQIPDKCKL